LKYFFDSNAVIIAIDGTNEAFGGRMAQLDEGDIAISTIVLAEVAYGSAQGKAPPMEILAKFLEEVSVLSFDETAALTYSALPFRRGGYDRLIAAHSIALGLPLITANVADFADVPGLRVEDWTV
jgi:tRNA(fMet)-specific endonuclease VapC